MTELKKLPEVFTFEDQIADGSSPVGWSHSPSETAFSDNKIAHGGHWSVRLERGPKASGNFTTLHRAIAATFSGKTIQLRGFLRLENVTDFAGLWVREDGESFPLAFDNMQNAALKGTSDWKEYTITLPLHEEAKEIFFGALLVGNGKLWVDDLQLLVDGKPVWEVPRAEKPRTALDSDHQFDDGSHISLTNISSIQVQNLATLGKVWGFVKYHHALIQGGKFHWDYQLFRIMPQILEARDTPTAHSALQKWIAGLGEIPPCTSCAVLKEDDVALRPDVKWIEDESVLGTELSSQLRAIYRNRSKEISQFYVSAEPVVGNPKFAHEPSYSHLRLPDSGFQLLGLYRLWNIFEYWSPNRDIIPGNWDKVLTEFVPRIGLARGAEEYKQELFALIARAGDGHANLWDSMDKRPPVGSCEFPLVLRFIENHMVVTDFASPAAAKDSGLKVGDAIIEVDRTTVTDLIEHLRPYYSASNDAARNRDIARYLGRGPCGEADVRILRSSEPLTIKVRRVPPASGPGKGWSDDLPGKTFQLLSNDIAYLKLSSVKASDASHYIEQAMGTKALIIDIRNYPSEFVVFALGSLLVPDEKPFVRFTIADVATPGAFYWTKPLSISPKNPHYPGNVMILVDELSVSQSEYTAMAFRSVPGAVIVGSTTAGADGNVSPFPLPGGLTTMISGIGVFYPDKRPTQQLGIVPDLKVSPTIAGIREGRDEVLEAAIGKVLGENVSVEQIRQMAKPLSTR